MTFAGKTFSNDGDVTGNHGYYDFWIVKLGSYVSVKEVPHLENYFQIRPNPFSDETILSLELSIFDKITIEIHDLEGRLITNLNSENLRAGPKELIWDATDNSGSQVDAGIYFISIRSDDFFETKKVVVLRN